MTTRLEGELRRAITVRGQEYKVTLSAEGLKLTPRGKRNGVAFTWQSLLGGDQALAAALNASLRAGAAPARGAAGPKPSRS